MKPTPPLYLYHVKKKIMECDERERGRAEERKSGGGAGKIEINDTS